MNDWIRRLNNPDYEFVVQSELNAGFIDESMVRYHYTNKFFA